MLANQKLQPHTFLKTNLLEVEIKHQSCILSEDEASRQSTRHLLGLDWAFIAICYNLDLP
jgi:hypothetical protein